MLGKTGVTCDQSKVRWPRQAANLLTRVDGGGVVPGVIRTEALAGELALDGGVVAGGDVVAALGIVRVGAADEEAAVPRRRQHSDVVLAVILGRRETMQRLP